MRQETIGACTLYLGDCLEIAPALGLKDVDMLLTDPPYGITCCKWDQAPDLPAFWNFVWPALKQNAAACVLSRQPFMTDVVCSCRKWFRYELIARKSKGTRYLDANRMPLQAHDNIGVFYRKLPTYNPQKTEGKQYNKTHPTRKSELWGKYLINDKKNYDGARYPLSVIDYLIEKDFHRRTGYERHPTQKPVPLMEWLVKTYTNEGETVLDPFMGSGSTGVACVNCNRKFAGIEREQKYFDAALFRIEKALAEKSPEAAA